jgi:leader peptidase (prepilin peptidase)/N-methyltransferase
MISLYIFILGACIGSFLNVVIYRYNTGLTINGRSKCFSCGRTLVWYDLIPIFSFLAFKGRCRTCKSKISWQYPAVELTAALLFLGLYNLEGISTFLIFDCVIWSILLVITVYDLRHKIIPDGLVALFISFSFIRLLLSFPLTEISQMSHVLDILAGPLFYTFLSSLVFIPGDMDGVRGWKISHRNGIFNGF